MKLKEIRTAKGYSQEQLANVLYVKQNTVSQWENGQRQIKAEMIAKICEVLDTTFNELFGIPSYLI